MYSLCNSIKKIIKSNIFLTEILKAYIVKFEYGYIHTKTEIRRFLKKLNRYKRKNVQYDTRKKNLFIFIGDKHIDSTMRRAVFGDIDLGNVSEYECKFYTTRVINSSVCRVIHNAVFKLNKLIPLPFKRQLERLYTTNEIVEDEKYNMFFIFLAGAYYEETFSQPYLLSKIHTFGEKTFCKRILYMVDPIDKYPLLPEWFSYFDMIASYSHDDEKKYGAVYIDSPCVKFDYKTSQIYSDIYFRAMDSGRGELVNQCYNYFSSKGVKCDFYIQTDSNKYISQPGMVFGEVRVDYETMLQEELNANVLLEVVIPGIGSGTTLRYKEAVMYGKKLLTNNPHVHLLELYNPEYVRFFEKPEDIDINWIKEQKNIDFLYKDEFSTTAFCRKIVCFYNENRSE